MAVELYTRIEDYLDGILGEQERLDFEAELAADPALARALATVQEARDRLRRQWADEPADAALLDTLKQLAPAHFKTAGQAGSGGGRIFRLPQAWWAAAAAMAILIVAWLFLRPTAQERLYAEFRTFPEADFTVRGGSEPAGQSLPAAAEAFNRQDYSAALPILQNYLQVHPDDLEKRLFAGLCYLELKQYEAAGTAFQQIADTPGAWSDEAEWYLALTYLRQNKRSACIQILARIPAESGRYAQAAALLEQLK